VHRKPPFPARLGPYTLVEPIGHGAFGSVWFATDDSGRGAAVKIRRRGDANMDRRFLREFETMRLLRLSGVVPVHNAGIEDQWLWFSMDRVHGVPFHEAILDLPTMADRVERWISSSIELFDTLTALHEAGFAHRDVKPSNILVEPSGAVHMLDFGISRYFSASETMSRSDEILGTMPYMAPEQIANVPNSERVDLFAAGLMLYEALAGPRPAPSTPVGWISRICMDALPSLSTVHLEIPLGVSALVDRLLEVDPLARPTARQAAACLRAMKGRLHAPAAGPRTPFVSTGDWWHALEGCVGQKGSDVQILEGRAGSGRGRILEQIHRRALLDGIWTIHTRCEVTEVGGPLVQLLEAIIDGLDDSSLQQTAGDSGTFLRRWWPHLQLPGGSDDGSGGRSLAGVLSGLLHKVSQITRLLVVIEDLERVDTLTAGTLARIAEAAGPRLGFLITAEPRWKSPMSRRLVRELEKAGAQRTEMPALTAEVSNQIRASFADHRPTKGKGPKNRKPAKLAQYAAEAAHRAHARKRGTAAPRPDASLWPLAVLPGAIPAAVFMAVVGHIPDKVWVRHRPDGWLEPRNETVLGMARARLAKLPDAARALAETWTAQATQHPGSIAKLWLLAGDLERGRRSAAQAAVSAERQERYAEARRWLLVVDTIDPRAASEATAFQTAHTRARVELYTGSGAPRPDLIVAAEVEARTPEERQAALLLRAQHQRREGAVRSALVAALRVGSQAKGTMAAEALLVAVDCRLRLRQPAEAKTLLDRARAALKYVEDDRAVLIRMETDSWRGQLAYEKGDLLWCRAISEEVLRKAQQHGYEAGIGDAALRLARTHRLLGRRRRAEEFSRLAQSSFEACGDARLDAEASLVRAGLMVERGDPLGGERLLDDATRRVSALGLDHLLRVALRINLLVAIAKGDVAEASVAMKGLDLSDEETPAVLARWWRTRGDVERAAEVSAPTPGTYGHVAWLLESSRSALAADDSRTCRKAAREARHHALQRGFAELALYAKLLFYAADQRTSDDSWATLVNQAAETQWTETCLGALALDARRLSRNKSPAAQARWAALRARASELGYRPAVDEADGWLGTKST
jgi:hypothetical protein